MSTFQNMGVMAGVLRRAWYMPLQEEDMPQVMPATIQASKLGVERILAAWERERQQKKPSLQRMMVSLCKREGICGMATAVATGALTGFVRPFLLKLLINDAADKQRGMILAAFVCLTLLLEAQVVVVNKYELGDRVSSALVASLGVLVQRKGLCLAPGVAGDLNERVLMAADVIPAFENWRLLWGVAAAFSSLIFGMLLLVVAIGWVGFLGGLTILAAIALARYLSLRSRPLEVARLDYASRRLGITTRTLDSIRAVKFCAWEDRFLKDIRDARAMECQMMKRFRLRQFISSQIGRVTPIFAAAFTYAVVIAAGWELDAGMVYAVLSTYQSMRAALVVIPISVSFLIALSTSFERVTRYLALPELDTPEGFEDEKLAIDIEHATFRWPVDATAADGGTASAPIAVDQLRLQLPWGTLTGIIGGVGSGKSGLLTAVLGELRCDTGGKFRADLRSVGVVTQKAFVVNATLQENVVFGRPWDEALFNAVAWAAALDVDLKQLPGGRLTEIGERGVTLSGGQQQRLSIARALYGQPRLLVLDDPLAAVDGRVAGQIFSRAIRGDAGGSYKKPEGQVLLMCLNQFRFLHQFDRVLFMENGKVVEEGLPQELVAQEGRFASFVGGSIGNADGSTDPTALDEEEPPTPDKPKGQLVQKELRASGKVKREVYMAYLRGMGWWRVAVCLLLGILTYAAFVGTDQWLAYWVETRNDNGSDNDSLNVFIYCVFAVAFTCLEISRGMAVAFACVATSKHVHDKCISHLLRAPMSYFDETPSGRLISRFGADLGMVDGLLAMLTEGMFSLIFNMAILLVIICITSPLMLIIVAVALLAFFSVLYLQDVANQDVKRISNNALSPVLTCLGETSEAHGKLIVRSMKFSSLYCKRFDTLLDNLNTSLFVGLNLIGTVVYSAYSLSFVIAAASSYIILNVGSSSPARLGLALTYAFLLPYFMNMVGQTYTVFTICLTSLERLLQSAGDGVPQEPAWTQPGDAKLLDAKWPTAGAVSFEDVSLVYRPGLPPALSGCSFQVPGGSKVGVVGRSGAGKSSLFVALFRLVEPSDGRVTIDGSDTASLGLGTLRGAMAIIPQEPLLFEGTIRGNIDPLSDHSAESVAAVLAAVGLQGREEDLPRQLSAGERQLLQMARTLLRRVPIVVMDEPTSNIDPRTDALVQRVLREAFAACTVLTIAHRLDTVIDADQVLVMDAGRVAESGAPQELLGRREGPLSAMVDGQGAARAAELRLRAAGRADGGGGRRLGAAPPPDPKAVSV